jgi:cobalt/nickel-transporting P-type ATPase D
MTLTALEVTAHEVLFDGDPDPVRQPSSWHAALWSVVSVRWAAVALALFLVGLTAALNGAAETVWWTLYLACYLTGGWGSWRSTACAC